jgi:hypothetical protein
MPLGFYTPSFAGNAGEFFYASGWFKHKLAFARMTPAAAQDQTRV